MKSLEGEALPRLANFTCPLYKLHMIDCQLHELRHTLPSVTRCPTQLGTRLSQARDGKNVKVFNDLHNHVGGEVQKGSRHGAIRI